MLEPISVPCLVDVTEITKDTTVNVCSTTVYTTTVCVQCQFWCQDNGHIQAY